MTSFKLSETDRLQLSLIHLVLSGSPQSSSKRPVFIDFVESSFVKTLIKNQAAQLANTSLVEVVMQLLHVSAQVCIVAEQSMLINTG